MIVFVVVINKTHNKAAFYVLYFSGFCVIYLLCYLVRKYEFRKVEVKQNYLTILQFFSKMRNIWKKSEI